MSDVLTEKQARAVKRGLRMRVDKTQLGRWGFVVDSLRKCGVGVGRSQAVAADLFGLLPEGVTPASPAERIRAEDILDRIQSRNTRKYAAPNLVVSEPAPAEEEVGTPAMGPEIGADISAFMDADELEAAVEDGQSDPDLPVVEDGEGEGSTKEVVVEKKWKRENGAPPPGLGDPLAVEVGGMAGMVQSVQWVFEAIKRRDVKEKDAPTKGAWAFLGWARENPSEFYGQFAKALMPTRSQVEAESRYKDDGRERLERLEEMSMSFVGRRDAEVSNG